LGVLDSRKWLANFSDKLWVRNPGAFIVEGEIFTEREVITEQEIFTKQEISAIP
jgi:hypothetical protein